MAHPPGDLGVALTEIVRIAGLVLTTVFFAPVCFGQQPKDRQIQELKPSQTLEREIDGAETHPYQFNLQKDEFFQVRVEQKGVDIALKLLDVQGSILTTMDSPKQGPEAISFIAERRGSFVLQISSPIRKRKGVVIQFVERSRPTQPHRISGESRSSGFSYESEPETNFLFLSLNSEAANRSVISSSSASPGKRLP